MNPTFLRIWKYPILLAIITAAGLFMALVGAGIWHWLAWLALTIPLLVCFRYTVFRKGSTKQN